eukprot:CAMPEP_0116115578 /NCGR_PEP_ID=MMETSP0329-20121206/579_1 /TAXON_ID=697910 /ORGANISM="Pseudo-nitzschia arenysensis, Strain B593" /LENGTH=759 /DNA_ID=CAMNT_0003609015 /DNA_START=23 /DNA_END=2299 /DNA_ORIENTATION=-
MIASSVKLFVLAGLLVLSMAVTISAEGPVCPNDFVLLPLADGAENASRRLQEVAPPIQVIAQGGDYVDFVVQSSTAFNIEPEHLFVQYESGEFFNDKCLMFEDLELGSASSVMRASCVAGQYAVIWVHARSFTTLGQGSAEIPQCCQDPYADSIPTGASTTKFAYELKCVPSCDDPITTISDAPTSSPSSSPSVAATEPKLPRRALQEEIIKDMMPAASGKCSGQTASSTFEFQSSQAESQWYAPFVDFEEELFLAKMQHADNNFNRSWTIRFGQAGNIYSMVGPMGETVPPQEHNNAPWVDEVWQAVQPLGSNGDNDGDPSTGPYFIHEAGTYTRDAPYTDKPFYSPTLGSYCNDGDGECGFASWGQHAHVPTPWKSPMLYLNRYVNCGNGVFEYTTLRHNIVGSNEAFGYLNVPWGGTRRSVLGDIVLTNKNTQELEPLYPLDAWGDGKSRSLDQTMGFTVFAEDLPKESNPLHDQPYGLPSGLDLTIGGQCFCEGNCNKATNRYVCPLVSQPANIGWTPNRGAPGLIVRLEGRNSGLSVVAGVRHWAGNGNLYFYKSELLTLTKIRAALTVGSKVDVFHYYPPTGGREEDNLALAHVHGAFNGPGPYPRVRYGAAGRDFNVYTINDSPSIPAGSTYYYRQYFMMDSYTEMKAKGIEWSPETTKATKAVGTIAGRTVKLYDSGANTFGFTVGDDTCRPAGAAQVCEGSTTPQTGWKPVFEIYCGNSYAVTDDLYHFSPAGSDIRAYVCDGLSLDVRP